MSIIYEPQGPAAEYAYLCANLYSGSCQHQCLYCYVPETLRITREKWLLDPPHARKNIIGLLKKEAPKYRGTNKRLHLTFINDCYQPIEKHLLITRQAIQIFRENDIPFQVLTKAGILAERDFDLYGEQDMFGVTLTCAEDENSRKFEPYAASTSERIKILERAREKGIFTWVSLEPVLNAESSLELIRRTSEFCCHYKMGVLNHQQMGSKYSLYDFVDYRQFGIKAIELCRRLNVGYFIKDDLANYLYRIAWNQIDTRIAK